MRTWQLPREVRPPSTIRVVERLDGHVALSFLQPLRRQHPTRLGIADSSTARPPLTPHALPWLSLPRS